MCACVCVHLDLGREKGGEEGGGGCGGLGLGFKFNFFSSFSGRSNSERGKWGVFFCNGGVGMHVGVFQ